MMDIIMRQLIEVYKLPNGKYVICLIYVAPRSIIYFHKQKEPHQSYRWMREEDWSAFDNAIEGLASETNYAAGIDKFVELNPLVQLKVQSILDVTHLCQIDFNKMKDLTPKNIAMAVKCEIKYGEIAQTEKFEEKGNSLTVNDELVATNFKEKCKEVTVPLKPDEDLDQQIQSFHIGQQESSSPLAHATQKDKNLSPSGTKAKKIKIEPTSTDRTSTRRGKRSKEFSEEKIPQEDVSPPARQRRTVSKPKRFHEFVMEPKRQSQSPKTEPSDNESSTESRTPKRVRKIAAVSQTVDTKSNKTNVVHNTKANTTKPCNRTLFQQDKDLKSEMLSKKEYQRNMKELIEELIPTSPPKVGFLTLEDMPLSQVMSTLSEIKPRLDTVFKEVFTKDYIKSHGGIDHFLVIELISDQIKSEMMKKLGELYEKDDTPKYGSHILNVLLPEWILSLFTKRHNMRRDDAIEHIKTQNSQYFRLAN